MLKSLLSLLPLLSLAAALPVINANVHSGSHHHAKRQADSVASAITGLGDAVPKKVLPATALLTTGGSVDLYPVSGNTSITSESYSKLTKLIPTIMTNAIETSIHSWEIGSLVEALLEVYVPKLAPYEFASSAFEADIPWAALWTVEAWLDGYDWSEGPSTSVNVTSLSDLAKYLDASTTPTILDPQPLIGGDGALGDPVALGMGTWVLARYAMRAEVQQALSTGVTAAQLAWAAGNQLAYLRNGYTSDNGTCRINKE